MAESCAFNCTVTPACEPSPEKVSDFCPVPSWRCRSCNSLSILRMDCRSGDSPAPIPEIVMASSHLQQGVQHLLHRGHDPRIGAVGVLQCEQIGHFGIDV